MTIADFADMMGSKIIVANPSTADRSAFGVQPYSTAGSTYAMHWQQGKISRRYTDGLTDAAASMAWIASTSTSAIRRDSQFSLPDGTLLPCLKIVYERDADGSVHHTVAVFG